MLMHRRHDDPPALGDWVWDESRQVLAIFDVREDLFAMLSGEWTLAAFGHLLNGLSAKRVRQSLIAGSDHCVLDLALADGRHFQMIGGRVDETQIRGVLIADTRTCDSDEDDTPGPELVPVYQPIICLKTGKIAGFEALARWRGGDSEHFDDAALASNMLIHASEALAKWRNLAGVGDIFVQVNLTSRDLEDEQLAPLVSALVSGHGFPKGALRLELTEQAALRDAPRAIEVAKALQKAGAALVLDDFGSGHSSFMWLAQLPAYSLKVDADLIAQIEVPRMRVILEAITLLAKRLGMVTTAEGVEDRALLHVLCEMNFDMAQGYALGRPSVFEDTLTLLQL
jgi:EAL domain-containing protein (putative c-di-GMP-specific phosphodiesterase class I)